MTQYHDFCRFSRFLSGIFAKKQTFGFFWLLFFVKTDHYFSFAFGLCLGHKLMSCTHPLCLNGYMEGCNLVWHAHMFLLIVGIKLRLNCVMSRSVNHPHNTLIRSRSSVLVWQVFMFMSLLCMCHVLFCDIA